MNLKNQQIREAVAAIQALQAFSIRDLKTNVNLARNLRRLRAADQETEEDRVALYNACFGVGHVFGSDQEAQKHPKYQEYDAGFKKLMAEETEIEKVLKIKLDGLEVVKDKAAVPGAVIEPLEFMIEDFEEGEQ